MPRYFDFYTEFDYHEYKITKKGYCMYRRGDCINNIQFPWHRITEEEYINAYNTYKGY